MKTTRGKKKKEGQLIKYEIKGTLQILRQLKDERGGEAVCVFIANKDKMEMTLILFDYNQSI